MKLKTRTVSELNAYISNVILADPILKVVSVKGEVSNLSGRKDAHIYFNLVDEKSQISCVLFKNNALSQEIVLKEGDKIVVSGSIRIYDKLGIYQISVTSVEYDTESDELSRLLALKAKLEKAGYFSASGKKPKPSNIRTIGLIASKVSAAYGDFITVMRRNSPLIKIVFIDCHVSGNKALLDIPLALNYLNTLPDIDLIVVTRGGGSKEDLNVFNDEALCKAVFDSKIPILAAIGHERDESLFDLTADLVKGTPSMAAEFVAEEFYKKAIYARTVISSFFSHLYAKLKIDKNFYDEKLKMLSTQASDSLMMMKKELQHAGLNALWDLNNHINKSRQFIDNKCELIKAYDKSAVLNQGYALLYKNGKPAEINALMPGDKIEIELKDRMLRAGLEDIVFTEDCDGTR